MGRVISTAIQFIDGFTKPSKEVINSMRSMGNEAIKAGKQIQSAGKTITSVGSTLTKAITVPIAGVATAAVKTAADFEAAMSEVGAISGASAQDLATLTAKAKEMGATTSFSASESAEAMKYMAMAGWKTADMTAGIAGIMNLAAAAGEDLGTTSDIVTDGLTAFGMSAKESGRFADVMAATSTNANTNVTMLGESFKYCAATAGAMGYNIEDISVALGVMANAGIKGSTAGTTLKNVIANMAKPTDAQAAVMQKLGISLTDSSGNMKSFAEVMNNLRSSFNGLSETEKASYATTLAGKESMSGLLTIVNASAADFDKLTEAINGSSGSAEAMAAKMLDNLKGQLTLLKSAVEGIAITIGDKLLPYLKKFVSWVQKAADYINNLSDAQVDSIMKWAAIAAAIPPIIMVFGKVVTMVGTVQRTFGTITKTIANFGGIIGTITSPAGIVIGVLAAIAVAAVLIIKNWDQVKAFLQNVGNWFKNAFEKAGFSVQGFKDKFTSIGNTVGNIAGKISSFVKNIAGIFKKEFAGSVGEGADAAGGAFETIVGGAVAAFDTIVTAVDKGLKALNAILEFFGGAFTGNWDSAAQDFRNSIKNIFPPDIAAGIINVFNTLLPGIKAVDGYESGELKELLTPARGEEKTEDFRARYLSIVAAAQAFGGNRAQYKAIMHKIEGVGACKIYRVTAQEKRIKIYFLDSTYKTPNNTLISDVQKIIDPIERQGEGAGEAAIYHVVDVLACTSESVKIEAKITIDTGYTWADLLASVQEKIDGYFLELAKNWENEQNITVRILKVNAAIASVEGIIDVQNTALNGREENLLLDPNAIPVRGVILCKQ